MPKNPNVPILSGVIILAITQFETLRQFSGNSCNLFSTCPDALSPILL